MSQKTADFEKRHRRTCWERWRYQVQRKRRATKADPAMSVFLQLMALIILIVARAPPLLNWSAAPLGKPRAPRQRDDWSPQQHEREMGMGGQVLPPLRRGDSQRYGRYRASPSYRRLVRDLRRPGVSVRCEALDVLRRRLNFPEGAGGWLEEIVREEDWAALAVCTPPGRPDAEAESALLGAALEWLRAKQPEDDGGGGSSPPAPALRYDGSSGDDGSPLNP